MQTANRGIAIVIAIAIVAVVAILFYTVDSGLETAPVERTPQQNSGVDAPTEQAPSPGTAEDRNGNAKLPAQ